MGQLEFDEEPVTEAVWVAVSDMGIVLELMDGYTLLSAAEADRVANSLMRAVEIQLSAKKEAA